MSEAASAAENVYIPLFPPSIKRKMDEERAALTSQEYLDRHKVLTYFQDGIAQLLDAKDEKPLHFLHKYFVNAVSGECILFREFRFINCTPHNRRSFLELFRRAYSGLQPDESIGLDEFHQLLCLLCPDFPYTLVQNAARIDLQWEKDPEFVKLGEFTQKLSLLFFYSEFMNHSAQSFKSLDAHDTGKVPRQSYLALLHNLVRTKAKEFSCPDASVLSAVLSPSHGDEVMFNEFCVRLFAHVHLQLPLLLEYPLGSPVVDQYAARLLADPAALARASISTGGGPGSGVGSGVSGSGVGSGGGGSGGLFASRMATLIAQTAANAAQHASLSSSSSASSSSSSSSSSSASSATSTSASASSITSTSSSSSSSGSSSVTFPPVRTASSSSLLKK